MAQQDPFTYFTVTGTAEYTANVKFSPNYWEIQASAADTSVVLRPVFGHFSGGILKGSDGKPGVKLVANTSELGMLPTPLTYLVEYSGVHYAVVTSMDYKGTRRPWKSIPEPSLPSFIFIAPAIDTTVNLDTVARLDPEAVLDNWIDPEAS